MFSDLNSREISGELIQAYLDYIVPERKNFGLHIVIDSMDGATTEVAPELFQKCGCQVDKISCGINGNFPRHPLGPDPGNEEYIKDLINAVIKNGADLGFAYDGDGDRLAVVDSDGKVIQPDIYTIVLLKAFNVKKGDKVVMDVRCSQALVDYVRKNGGQEIYAACGPTSVIGLMRRENGLLGCETTGHIYFNEPEIIFDDPLFATYKLVEYLSQTNQNLSDILKSVPEYYSVPEKRLNLKDGKQKEEDIFREYDIRGFVDSQVNEDLMKKIGQAFGSYIKQHVSSKSPKIIVSYDPRPSSRNLQQTIIEGLMEEGCSVVNGGMLPTSIYSFAIKHKKADAGLHITASHNPSNYNGVKIRTSDNQFGGEKLQLLKRMIYPETSEKKNEQNPIIDIAKQKLHQDHDVVDLVEVDGAKAFFKSGWGLLRASNTQPQLTMRFEAESEKALKEIAEKFKKILIGLPGIDDDEVDKGFDDILT
ncbi:MAG: hypothetical protein AAB116_16910 [Candidatus Poribacteria bacterium]